ncbi:MAG: M67 family metallopeptidase [Candidatus Omnitrophica bacterium]|nr:M67 family metallopeptidase [Candidatus Omnitrophota bacterium]
MEKMVEHCRREYPNEACGYLAGQGEFASAVYPITNDAASPTWYEMNPGEQLSAQKEIRREGMSHLAVYHSHVATEAYPSPRDVERATAVQDFFGGHYVLVTLKEKGRPQARAFKINDGHVQEEPLEEVQG